MAKLWLKNGRLVIKNGRLVLCDHCPCDSECMKAVKARVRQLVEVAETHEVVMSAGGGYNCPTFVYNEETEEWECTSMASGSLVLVLSRAQSMPDYFSWEADGEIMVYATTLRNKATQAFLTIGCYCSFNYETYECDHTYTELSGYCIAGTVDAYKVEEISQYDPWYACKGDECQIKEKKIEAYASWYGGTLYQEGFIIVSDGQGGETYQDVRRAWRYVRDNVEYYQVLDCYCDFLFPWEEQEWTSNLEHVAVPDFCKLPCKWAKILEIKAQRGGWTMHNEGAVFKTYSNSSVFNYSPYGRYLAGAVALDGIYVVGCGCSGLSKIPFTEQAPASSWTYLDMPDACTCLDTRELLTTYPDEFGVTEMAMGSNNIVRFVYNDAESREVINDEIASTTFLDYRTMVFVISAGNSLYSVLWLSPEGSPISRQPVILGAYTSVHIIGTVAPFTCYQSPMMYSERCMQTGCRTCDILFYSYPVYCWDEYERAEEEYNRPGTVYTSTYYCHGHDVLVPITGVSLTPHRIWQDSETGQWCAQRAWGTGLGPSLGPEWWDATIVYAQAWLQTNKGIMIATVGGYHAAYTLLGHNGAFDGLISSGAYGGDVSPGRDNLDLTATLIDEDMHFCHDDYVIPTDESDSSSSSASLEE